MDEQVRFTPGPWRVFRAPAPSGVLIGIGEVTGEGITDCGFGIWRDGEEAHANAALIAAAPDLYEALRGALGLLEMASINSDAFGGEDDPEYIASKAAWERDLAGFRAALSRAHPKVSPHDLSEQKGDA